MVVDAIGLSETKLVVHLNSDWRRDSVSRWNLHLNFRGTSFSVLRLVLLMSVLSTVGCMTASRPSRELMPTPLALSLGLSHPGSNCLESLTESLVPVFVISGRNVEAESGALDPFGNKRSH
jgi:hypothetical protein